MSMIGDNFVYMHLPRTAGASAEGVYLWTYDIGYSKEQHSSALNIDEEDKNKFIFGFVRNPYSWEYSFWKHTTNFWKVADKFPQITFEDYIRYRYVDENQDRLRSTYEFFPNHDFWLDNIYNFCRNPLAGFFSDWDGQCIASKIYKFEYLEESWQDVTNITGYDLMRFEWRPPSYEYRDHYTDFLYDVVTSGRRFDLELFGYTFDGNGTNNCRTDYTIGPGLQHHRYCFDRDFINL